jgi:GNAT superfamily N-acetyltransferase
MTSTPQLRPATPADVPALRALIAASVRGLSPGFYTDAQIESALDHMFGVDSQLIADGTYYVLDTGAELVAAGGWSARRTLFGGDQWKEAEDPRLDPRSEPARIRAFFVHPAWARQGLARRLFAECARGAWEAGFRSFELLATLPGEPLYAALGFTVIERVDVPLPGGIELPCARMERTIEAPPDGRRAATELRAAGQP